MRSSSRSGSTSRRRARSSRPARSSSALSSERPLRCLQASFLRSGRRGFRRSWRSAKALRRRRRGSRRAPYVALVTIAIAILALGVGLFAPGIETAPMLLLLGVGTIALFLGVALVASRLVQPLAAVVGWPAQKLGGMAGELARENSVRNPSRTASTAAALMIGLALVTVVAVLGGALRTSTQDAVKNQVAADYVVTSQNGFDPFPAAAGDAVAAAPGVEVASSVVRPGARRRNEGDVTGVTRGRSLRSTTSPGPRAPTPAGQLGADGAVVTKSFADDRDLALGSRFPVETAAGRARRRRQGIYDPSDLAALLGKVTIANRHSTPPSRGRGTCSRSSTSATAQACRHSSKPWRAFRTRSSTPSRAS